MLKPKRESRKQQDKSYSSCIRSLQKYELMWKNLNPYAIALVVKIYHGVTLIEIVWQFLKKMKNRATK